MKQPLRVFLLSFINVIFPAVSTINGISFNFIVLAETSRDYLRRSTPISFTWLPEEISERTSPLNQHCVLTVIKPSVKVQNLLNKKHFS